MTPNAYVFAPYRLLPQQRQLLSSGDQPVKLGGRAFDMLLALLERRERTVSKHELIDLVWPRLVVEENNLQVQMVALRKLLGHAAIATIPGRGYRFTLPVVLEFGSTAAPAAAAATDEYVQGPPKSKVPSSLPSFHGREADVQAVLGLLERHALVTIAGAGGIGKTRLAQAAAALRLAQHPDGVWWVDLSSLGDPARIDETVAQAIGCGANSATDAVSALWAALPAQKLLLVLDNAEHLLQGVTDFAERVRREAPGVRLLVTSQEVLRVADERVLRLEPLALPDGDDPAVIEASAAVALFVARAQAVSRRFMLDADNRHAVADICRRLDGIPLAIELAAARVELLGVEGLREKLDQRFHFLTAGHRSPVRRHQTLRAALEWSHHLLSLPEQAVLRRLSVFVGGFTLDAAQQVAGADDEIDRWDVLEHLGALVDKSLVVAEGEAIPRYRLLESTRLFGLERLIESGDAADARSRHRESFVALAEAAWEQMLMADPRGLGRLDLERDNLFLALAWQPAGEDATSTLRLAAALRYYWTSRGMLARGLEVMLGALAHAQAQPPCAAKCHVQGSVGHFQSLMGNLHAARPAAEAAVAMARGLSDPALLCLMLCGAGFIHLKRVEQDLALQCAQEAMALRGAVGDCRALGNAMSLSAAVHVHAGEGAMALQWCEEALALWQRLGHPWSESVAHLNLASMALERGTPAAALTHLRQVLALLPRVDSHFIGVHLMEVTAAWAADVGLDGDSVRLDAASAAHMMRIGKGGSPDAKELARAERTKAKLDVATMMQLQRTGNALSYRDALGQVATLLAAKADN